MAKHIVDTYGACQFCGFDDHAALEAAHIKDFSEDGPDDETNFLCLCSNCHNIFDAGLIGFFSAYVIVSKDDKNRPYLLPYVNIPEGVLDDELVLWKWNNGKV